MFLLALYVLVVICDLGSVSPFTFTSFTMTKKKRTAAQFFDDAETHGLEPLMKTDLNSDKVSKHLESGTETNYTRMLVLWDESVSMSFLMTAKYC